MRAGVFVCVMNHLRRARPISVRAGWCLRAFAALGLKSGMAQSLEAEGFPSLKRAQESDGAGAKDLRGRIWGPRRDFDRLDCGRRHEPERGAVVVVATTAVIVVVVVVVMRTRATRGLDEDVQV